MRHFSSSFLRQFGSAKARYRAIRNDQDMLRGRMNWPRRGALQLLRDLHPAPTARLEDQSQTRGLYRAEGLSMRHKGHGVHVIAGHRAARPAAGAINENWSMDFVSDALFDGRRIRALTVVDDYSRESLAIKVGQSITGEQVVTVMNRLSAMRGAPKRIRVDNGPEFVSSALVVAR